MSCYSQARALNTVIHRKTSTRELYPSHTCALPLALSLVHECTWIANAKLHLILTVYIICILLTVLVVLVVNSRDWLEFIKLFKILHFIKQPCNKSSRKKSVLIYFQATIWTQATVLCLSECVIN